MSARLTDYLSIIILAAFVVRTVRNSIYHLFLWQNKEYRLDRMLIHFRTKEGLYFLFGLLSSIKLLLFLIFSLAVFQEVAVVAQASIWLFGAVLLAEAVKNLRELSSGSLPMPVFSLKIVLILFVTWLLQSLLIFTSSPRFALDYLPFLDKTLGAMIAMQIGVFSIFARIRKELIKMLAREKLDNLARLKVIGITGSYGKTSTKEFTAQLLAQKFSVVKTPANTNTAIGVANTVLREINDDTEYFVMEAAAYKKGEIEEIASLIGSKLKVALLTGINEQHLDLFKTLQNIEEAKYELVKCLGRKGIAVFNANNPRTRKLSQRTRKQGVKVLLYGKDKRFFAFASDIKQTRRKLGLKLHVGRNQADVTAPVLGKHNAENILAAAVVACVCGVGWKKIARGISTLQPARRTMNYNKTHNAIIIDDSYNANPDGAMAALEYLQIYNLPKVMVLRPLIELGREAENVHKRIGKKAASICDLVVLTDRNYYKSFMQGVKSAGDTGRTAEVVVDRGKNAKQFIEQRWKGNKVVLFEGRDSEGVLREYIKA